MVFKLSATFKNPATSQSGFPAPGDGAQTTGIYSPPPENVAWEPSRPAKGFFSWFRRSAQSEQRGYPSPLGITQARPKGSMPNSPPVYGGNMPVTTPYFSRGAAATVQNYGKVLYNPIGAGVVALHRPQASYGSAGQYAAGQIFWATQVIPTSINLQGLTDPQELAAILDPLQIQAVVRTTG